MPNSPVPLSPKEKWSKALKLCFDHPLSYWGITLLHLITLGVFFKGRHHSYFGESIEPHLGLSLHDGLNLFLLLFCLFLSSLLVERIDESHRHVISDITTSCHKAWRRLLNVAVALFSAFFAASLLLLPFILTAIHPAAESTIRHFANQPIFGSSFMTMGFMIFSVMSIWTIASYGLNRCIYAPIIASIHGCPGLQSTKSSFIITSGQWLNGIRVIWLPMTILFMFTYKGFALIMSHPLLAVSLTYGLLLPFFFSLLVVELRSMLHQRNTNLESLTQHSPSAW